MRISRVHSTEQLLRQAQNFAHFISFRGANRLPSSFLARSFKQTEKDSRCRDIPQGNILKYDNLFLFGLLLTLV